MCFMVPGLSSGSVPINMHYNLAQGVSRKGYPITSVKEPLLKWANVLLQRCKAESDRLLET